MYSIDDKLIKSPVISSQHKADRDLADWLKNNRYTEIKDASGFVWSLKVKGSTKPDPADSRKGMWEVRLILTGSLSAQVLHATGIFVPDSESDQRLAAMLGAVILPITVRPVLLKAHSVEEIRRLIIDQIGHLRGHFGARDFAEIKRKIVGRWVNDKASFGVGEISC
jgi:hypothetical protein